MESKKTSDIWQPLLYALVLVIGMFLGTKFSSQHGNHSFYSSSNQLDNLVHLISERYVDSIDEKVLVKNGIEGIIKSLDPHTVYIPVDKLGRVNEELEGSFYGIGIEFYLLHDTVVVSSIIPNGPSSEKDIAPGDKIIKIDDTLIAGKSIDEDEIIRRIRGQQNSSIKLELLRFDGSKPKVEITRDQVPLKSVSAFFKVDDETGFIKINMFSETTYEEFKSALQSLTKSNIKKLIIDVRDNPGGYMDAVANVADELVSGKHTIVTTKGKQKSDSLETSITGLFENGKLCILVDENSASASEILAGSIQDLDRGTIIGRRTYGKGLVQEQFELPDHSAIRITTARYYLPSGRCIQRSYSEGKEKYKHDIIDRFKNGELEVEDSSREKTKIFYTSKKRIVYGEVGVMPDLFIPLDTVYHSQLDDFYTEHIAEEFAHWYNFYHKDQMLKYPTLDAFSKQFSIDDSLLSSIKIYLNEHAVRTDILSNKILFNEIETSLRTEFAKLLFGSNGKYKELYRNDPFIQKAIQHMQSL